MAIATAIPADEVGADLAAAVRAGCFASEQDAVREAIRALLAARPQVRLEAAIRRYLDREITLGRAADVAGLTRWEFQDILKERGVRVEV